MRGLLSENGRFPSRCTWERRLKSLPATLPAQIGCLGWHLINLIQPWATCGRAVAIDSTVLRAQGGVWHQKHREQGERPHTSIDPEAHWTKSGRHALVYGWKLNLVMSVNIQVPNDRSAQLWIKQEEVLAIRRPAQKRQETP